MKYTKNCIFKNIYGNYNQLKIGPVKKCI